MNGMLTVGKKKTADRDEQDKKMPISLRLSLDSIRQIEEIIAHYGLGDRTGVIEKAVRELHERVIEKKK